MKQASAQQGGTSQVALESMSNVGRELNVALDQARARLELYLERGDNLDPLAECADTLHQIRGVLNVVELYGAAQLADEMEKSTRFVVESPAVPRGDALEVLSRALVQLPAYLERVMAGARDIPFVLLPLLNDLRTVRGAPLLNENTLFLLNVSQNERPPEALAPRPDARPLAEMCKKLRPRFQASLLGWITGNAARDHIKILLAISIEIEETATEPAVHRLWRVVGALLEALRDGGLESGAAIKRLLGQVDQQIKRLIDLGEAGVARQPPDDLVNNILYYVGRARGGGRRVKDVKRAFDLEKLLPEPDRVVRERDGLAGPSPDLMRTVGAAIKDDLGQVKDGLDIFLRTGCKNPQDLQHQRDLLKKIGDTLSMLGLGRLRRDVEIENARLARMVTGAVEPEESGLMDIAATLLRLEDKLDKELLLLIDPRRDMGSESTDSKDDADYRAVAQAVIGECLVNLARVKDAIVSFVAHSDDPNALENVSGLMRGIRSAMLLLERERVSDLVARIGDYVQHHIRFSGKPPSGVQVERVADAIVSLEYYLETLMAGRADPWYMLDNAEGCMQALRRVDDLPEFESREEPTGSITEIYREGMGASAHVSTTQVGFAPTRVLRQEVRKFEVFSPEGERSDPEFLELFIEEAKEEIDIIRGQLSRLKDNKSDKEALRTLRRSLHTLKGSGRMVGAQLIGEFAWSVENLLNRVIEGTLADDEVLGVVNSAGRALPELVEQLEVGTEPDVNVDALMSQAWALAEGAIEDEKTTVVPRLEDQQPVKEAELSDEATALLPGYANEHEPEQLPLAIEMDTALLEIFAKETASHLDTLRGYVRSCADKEPPFALNEDVRRAAHTLHGSANMASVSEIVAIAEPLDHYVSESFNAGHRVPAAALKVLADSATQIEALVACINEPVELPETGDLVAGINDLHQEASEPGVSTEGLEVAEFEVLETEDDGDSIVTRLIEIPDEAQGEVGQAGRNDELTRQMETLGFSQPPRDVGEAGERDDLTRQIETPDFSQPPHEISEPGEKEELTRQMETPDLSKPPHEISEPGEREEHTRQMETPDFSQPPRDVGEAGERDDLTRQIETPDFSQPPHEISEPGEKEELTRQMETPDLSKPPDEIREPQEPEDLTRQVETADLAEAPFVEEEAPPPEAVRTGTSYDQEIAGIFVDEAAELLDNAEAALQALQEGSDRGAALDDLRRQLHTLKGGARMAGISTMGDLSHELESLLKRQDGAGETAGEQLLTIVQESIDRLHRMRDQISDGAELVAEDDLLERVRNWTPELLQPVDTQVPVLDEQMPAEGPPGELATEETTEASAAVDEDEEQASEEVQAEALAPEQELPTPVIEPVRARFDAPATLVPPERRAERQDRARVDAELLQRLLDNAGEISIFRARIEQQMNSVGFNLAELSQTVTRLRDQLRKLEIETEAQILFRHQAEETTSRGDFDPLELDRYSNIQQLSRSLSETTGDLMSIQELLDSLVKESEDLLVQQSRVATELQHGLMRTRMVPFQQNAKRLGRVVRQTASEAGKQVELHIEGGQGEMDRQMLERMMPVLEHMARNAVIHGIEDHGHAADSASRTPGRSPSRCAARAPRP